MKNITIILAIIIVIGAIALFSIDGPKSDTDASSTTQAVNDTEETPNDTVNDQTATTPETMGDMSEEEVRVAGTYELYTPEKVARADTQTVLFFKASWCPSCRVLDADIQNSLDDIPQDVTILEVDYDTNTDLRKQYGVTVQHTLVHVDADGNEIAQWSGGSSLESILTKLN